MKSGIFSLVSVLCIFSLALGGIEHAFRQSGVSGVDPNSLPETTFIPGVGIELSEDDDDNHANMLWHAPWTGGYDSETNKILDRLPTLREAFKRTEAARMKIHKESISELYTVVITQIENAIVSGQFYVRLDILESDYPFLTDIDYILLLKKLEQVDLVIDSNLYVPTDEVGVYRKKITISWYYAQSFIDALNHMSKERANV